MINLWTLLTDRLVQIGSYLSPLGLRIILAWEFLEAGLMKYNGSNWFSSVQDSFPFPFNIIPPEISWFLATWTELIGAFAIALGLATRFFSLSLIILTVVATAAVHWPDSWNTLSELLLGYAVRDNGFGNFKLPVLFLVMLVPLVLTGPGRLSMDFLIKRLLERGSVPMRVAGSVA